MSLAETSGAPSSSSIGFWLGDWQKQRAQLQPQQQGREWGETPANDKDVRDWKSPSKAFLLEAIGYDSIVSSILVAQLSQCLKHLGKVQGYPIEYDAWIRPVVASATVLATVLFSKPTPGQFLLNLKYRLSSRRGLRLAQGILAGVGPLIVCLVSHRLVRARPDLHIGLTLSIIRALHAMLFILRGRHACVRDWLLGLPMEWTSETGWRPEVNHSLMDIQLLLTELGRVSKSISKMALNFASLLPPGSSRADSQVGSTQCGFCGSVAISVPVALDPCCHLACYYCVQARLAAHKKLSCPSCAKPVQGFTRSGL